MFPSLSSDSIIRGGIKTNVKIFWWLRDRETLFRVFCKCFVFSFFFFAPSIRVRRYVYNDRVSGKIFEDDITSFRSTISVDRLERAKLECHGVFSEKSFNVVGKHLSLRHNKYCQCKRLYESFCSCFRPAFPHTFFPRKDCVICDNIFSINKRYIRIYFSSSFEIDIFPGFVIPTEQKIRP